LTTLAHLRRMSTVETTQTAYLSISQLATYLGISRASAYRLINSQDVPVIRIGGLIKIPKDELSRWLKRHTT
jgi:excisionase family DNA binding protein